MKQKIKTICKNAVLIYLVLSFLILPTACNKTENGNIDNIEQIEYNYDRSSPWFWIGFGISVVFIVINVTSGQYREIIINNPDGSSYIERSCDGLGHCHISAYLPGSTLQAISSTQENDGYDFFGTAQLIKTENGNILLKIDNTRENEEAYQRFYYDSILKISQPLIIDNDLVLNQLGRTDDTPIVISGEYIVYDSQIGKLIVLE